MRADCGFELTGYSDPSRKFNQVEMAYFSRWWHEQTPQRREQTRALVKNGQLEFALGEYQPDVLT